MPDIALQRLYHQRISDHACTQPGEVVAWLGAMQAQDYLAALWAVGLRMQHATEALIEQALADRAIVRTWPMRGTLHFVAPADVRWMLELLTPRVIAKMRGRYQELELDDTVFARSEELIVSALQGGHQLTRDALYQLLEANGIATANNRGLHILGRLSQGGVLCFGARAGKQQTLTLLEEWVPAARPMPSDEALAELARRYFTSHGPATLQDFIWWSGLTTSDARAGVAAAQPQLIQETIDGQSYWLSPDPAPACASGLYLLPSFDEYLVSYRDRSAALDPQYSSILNPGNGVFSPVIVVDGRVVGTWKRTFKNGAVVIAAHPFAPLRDEHSDAFAVAAQRYGEFLGMPVVLR